MASSHRIPARFRVTTFAALLLALSCEACISANADGIVLSRAWTRATPPGIDVAAGYVTIENRGRQADMLLSVSSPAAAKAELHRTTVENGMSRMRPAGEITIAGGESVTATPGGLHIMLTGLTGPLAAGSKVPLTLHFREAGAITVQMEVQAANAGSHGQARH